MHFSSEKPCCLSHVNFLLWVLVHLPATRIMCLTDVSTTGYSVRQGQGTFVFLSKTPFVGGSEPQSGTVSSFYPSLYLCVSILHVLIAPRPFTRPVSNGIACRGHRPWSRSCKCTAHVWTNSPIDASLAPMSGRIEPSAVLFLSEPYLDSLKALEIELKSNGLESRASMFNRSFSLEVLILVILKMYLVF